MTIPLLVRGRAPRASTADTLRRSFFSLLRTPKFRNPLSYPARTAVLRYRFSGHQVRTFSVLESTALSAFRPVILVGEIVDLRVIKPVFDALRTVVVLSREPMALLDRNWLWERFQVPSFEQLVNSRFRVVAEECEAHSGLHVLDASAPGLRTSVECECGRTEPRIVT